MKKKIYSILTMFLVALSCVFASACGNKYENMEYQVWYAYSANAKTWHDGTNGISVVYTEDYELVDGEEQSSLIFDEGVNQASLYIKVEVKNVKAKHIGSISMSFSSVSGLEFASKMISHGEVVEVPIRKDVKINTVLKLQENNSGKAFSTGFRVSKRLESMEANLEINPAMFSTATLNLSNLTNDVIQYNPSTSITNETGVKYSIGGIGYFTTNGEFYETKNDVDAEAYVALEDDVLSIKNEEFITANANAIKVIATSIYHDGTVEPEDIIQTHFYVYVVKTSALSVPNVKFDNAEGLTVEKVDIYENGKTNNGGIDYSESILFVDGANEIENLVVNTTSGDSYCAKEVVYVKAANGLFKKYNFAGENQQEGINGLTVISAENGDVEENSYKLKIFDRNVQNNTIKIAYEFEGLNFSYSTNSPLFEKNIVVNKLAVPRVITVNNKDFENGEKGSESIYVTSSEVYEGIALKLDVNPTTNPQQKIKIIKDGNLIVSDSKGRTDFTEIAAGSTIYVKLEGGSSADASLTFATLRTPTYYNGKNVAIAEYEEDKDYDDETANVDYITVAYDISKIVTANHLSFVDVNNNYEEFGKDDSTYIAYDRLDYIYVKAVHSNINLDLSSIKLISSNSLILFSNGKTETTLEYCSVVSGPTYENNDYYSIYKVGIQKTNSICEGTIKVVAAEGKIGKEALINVESVDYSMYGTKILTTAASSIARANLSNAYMLAKGSMDEFTIKLLDNANDKTRAIKSVKVEHKQDVNQRVDIIGKAGKVFELKGSYVGVETLVETVEYFALNNATNAIKVETKTQEIQVGVINPISAISVTATKRTISYVSAYYGDAGETEITFRATADHGEPITSSIKFCGDNGLDVDVSVGAGIIISVDEYSVYNYLDKGLIYYNSADISALVESRDNFAGKFILESDESSFEHSFKISLAGEVDIEKIKFDCSALMDGIKTNVDSEIVINIEKPNRASGIAISGSSLLKLNEKEENKIDDAEIQMSFMTIPDGGSVSTSFNAKILFEGDEGKKHDSLNKDLVFIIYEYELDENGYFKKVDNAEHQHEYKKVLKPNAFSVIANGDNKTITLEAKKQHGGGYFKLVIATKDSYRLKYEEQEIELEYFNVVRTITVVIADGVKAAYPIYNAEDLMCVNANLGSKFALYNNIEIDGEYPLGFDVNKQTLNIFNGSFSGRPVGSDSVYTIKQTLQNKAKSDSYGDIIGLFGILGERAIVKDLNYALTFANEKHESNLTALYVGAIAGVNKGLINNVAITIDGSKSFQSESNGLTFGGIVGVNEGTISNIKVDCVGMLKVEETQSSMYVGLVVGDNKGSILCGYTSKEDLNNYAFDVVANLHVDSTGNSSVYVGGVAGVNQGTISNMIIGGMIKLNDGGNLGGFAGYSYGDDSKIDTVVALSLDLKEEDGVSSSIGGIVGHANSTTIQYAKFVMVTTEFDGYYKFDENDSCLVSGGVEATNAGGLVCNSSADTKISDSSVESFVEKGLGSISATNADGLVLSGGAQITNSFVKAHVNEDYIVKFISNRDSEVDFSNSLADVELSNYLTLVRKDKIEDWVNVYISDVATISDTTVFKKADKETSDGYYYSFDAAKWENDAKDFVSASWADQYAIYGNWQIQQHYNVVSVKGVELFLPYLLREIPESTEKEPLMIVEPREISASINENYVTIRNSDMIPEYEEKETTYEITESVVVNYFSGSIGEDVETLNSYKLISDKGANNGLVDVDLLPENAQGRYDFKIVEGEDFAYINRDGYLVITKASYNQRILIEIYSPFNRDCKEYVAVYSQSLLTELAVKEATKISDGSYFANINVGSGKLFVEFKAENNNYPTIFDDLTDVRDYLDIKYTLSQDSKLVVAGKGFANFEIDINGNVNTAILEKNYSEVVQFELFIKPEYFNIHVSNCSNADCADQTHIISRVKEPVKIAETILEVGINSAARSLYIESGDREMESQSELDFDVYLETTRYDDKDTKTLFKTEVEDGKIVLEADAKKDNRDSIEIEFIHDTNAEIERIFTKTNTSCLAELFNVRIFREIYEKNDKSGYLFNVILSLKDERNYRSLKESFTFELKITAESAKHISDSIIVTIKPTELKNNGISVNTYAVKEISFNTEYSNFVSTENATNIIQPAGTSNGNVMKINISPSYAAVQSLKLESGKISVPGISGDVVISFEQLVYDEQAKKFVTLYSNEITQGTGSLELHMVSMRKLVEGKFEYDFTGEIFVKMNLPKFKGVEKEIDVKIIATKLNGETIEKTKTLITAFLPDTSLEYDDSKEIEDDTIENSYYIQKGSLNNEIKIKVVGYRFAGLPKIYIGWYDESKKDNINTDKDGEGRYAIDFLQYHLNTDDYNKAQFDLSDNSYTLSLYINAGALPAPIIVRSELKLTTIDGVEVSSQDEDQQDDYVVLCPTDYILTDYGVKNLSNGRKNIPINSNGEIELFFNTEVTSEDYSEEIFKKFIKDYTEDGQINLTKIANLFSYDNEETVGADTFANNINGAIGEELFKFKLEEQTINGLKKYRLVIEGKSPIRKNVTLRIPYCYKEKESTGSYELSFENSKDYGKKAEFELNIYIVNSENEIPIYTAEDIYNSSSASWNLVDGVYYILMNDIVLENVVPITTAIGQLDGNNRVISIKSFKVSEDKTTYGLFEKIGTYEAVNTITGQEESKPTILKNVIVDYSQLDGSSIPLNTSKAETLTIGGLVGVNDGGLIYNCDVVNANSSSSKTVSVIVPESAKVVFGGLVGENKGVITNSRVGRESYERIRINNGVTSQVTTNLGDLTFEVYGKSNSGSQSFVSEVAGLVGVNSGTISNSFVTRTNIENYSASEKTNKTAGFVATNNGTILSSYIKSDDKNINRDTNRSTGYTIEQKGNGIVAGFVYSNSGTISNSFANVELSTKSAYIAGFVYENLEQGVISESYAATTMNAGMQDNNAEQSFVGIDNAGNLMSFGTIKNSYYLMRNEYDSPYTQGDKNVAHALNTANFKLAENLTNFAFVLESSSSVEEQRQGIWSYNALSGIGKRVLPELTSANIIAFSHRYEKEITENGKKEIVFVAPAGYEVGTEYNPYTIASAEEYNRNFSIDNSGYFRLINNISFVEGVSSGNQAISISTKTNFTLGEENSSKITSFEGNGLIISGIYLDIDNTLEEKVESVGLFAKISNAYVKNLNLEFATPPAGQFSTTSATYSGGLAGKISNSAIMNIKLSGVSTTLVGQNFVGGLAGLVEGSSFIYGVESNLNILANKEVDGSLYYNLSDYLACNVGTESDYINHVAKLSYAGGIAGVIDIDARSGVEFNLNSLTLRGDLMSARTINGTKEANISGEYAGGIAGYAGSGVKALRLNVVMNKDEEIYAKYAVGGLFGVSLATVEASQVTAREDIQFNYDTEIGRYLLELKIKHEEGNNSSNNVVLDETKIGNTSLLSSDNYVGGLVGLGLGTTLKANYSKASVKYGRIIGGMIGVNVSSSVTYSYAVPFISSQNTSEEGTTVKIEKVGGMFGLVLAIKEKPTQAEEAKLSKLKEYSVLVRYDVAGKQYGVNASLESTYSSIIVDESFEVDSSAVLDYVAADYYTVKNNPYLSSSGSVALDYVFAGVYYNDLIKNNTKATSNSVKIEAADLYNLSDSVQELTFNEIFSGWSIIEYWSLDNSKYLPLLTTKVVDNFIIIDHEDDFKIMEANPDLNYKIVKDIPVTPKTSNWVVKCDTPFTGILLGERASDASRPIITIHGLTPNEENTSGFINWCSNATINNIEIVWVNQSGGNSSIVTGFDLDYVSGFVCNDEDSLISNVVVRAMSRTNTSIPGSVFSSDSTTISGFGGIVGKGKGTSVLGCEFISSVKATLVDNGSFGGIAGTLESTFNPDYSFNTNDSSESSTTALINGVKIGAEKARIGSIAYPQTRFDIKVLNSSSAYIGGVVGQTNNVSIATTTVGHVGAEDNYRNITINVRLEGSTSVYIGGVGGELKGGIVTGVTDLVNINVTGNAGNNTTAKSNVMIGGFAGQYSSIVNASGATTGVKKSTVQANITTESLTLTNSDLFVSTGFGQLNIDVEQSLFDGEVNTQSATNLPDVYSGSVAGKVDGGNIYLQEVISNSILNVGCSTTENLYVGGFIGKANNIEIESSATWGRIVPETTAADKSVKVYAGGFIGEADGIIVRNTYSLSSVIMDSLAGSSIAGLTAGALVGKMGTAETNKFENVYYSSDIALCVEENSVNDKPIGTNLSASTIFKTSEWIGTMGTFWGTLENSKIPHVHALEDELKKLKIYDKDHNEYAKGSIMNPEIVSNYKTFEDDYKFYLLSAGTEGIGLKLQGELNGVLIGADMLNQDTTYGYEYFDFSISQQSMGVVSVVNKHSAISNLHLYLGSGKSYSYDQTFNGFIAGLNNGVIFNCSVQGDEINIPTSAVGLIAGKNTGIISYSYSSAEVRGNGIGVAGEIAGIVYNNSGKMLSNYFTGYIDSSKPAAGMFMASDENTDIYLYNNYMGGVVTAFDNTAFAGIPTTDLEGSNNYIDKYSDVNYYSAQAQSPALDSINTASLMSNIKPGVDGTEGENSDEPVNEEDKKDKKLLKGSWNTTLDASGQFIEDKNDFFGRNYNYPSYKFNKMSGSRCIDYQKQIITGNGLMTLTNSDEVDASLTERYKYLIDLNNKGAQTDTYTYAYKIPHYGILQSVNALIGKNRNYVLMYDINAGVVTNTGGKTGVVWIAIGSDDVEGFKKPSQVVGFQGVFVTNRYFNQLPISDDNAVCTIQGVKGQGLFTNVKDAFIGNLNLGSFYQLQNSGALGVNVGTERNSDSDDTNTDDTNTVDTNIVYVDSINFTAQSVISGYGVAVADGETYDNYYAALFGKITGGSIVNITNFNTTNGDSSKLTLEGNQDTVGLIAGRVEDGVIQFKELPSDVPTGATRNADDKKLIALFDGNGIAGGLVGDMSKGSIDVEGYKVLISKTGDIENQDGVQNGVKENAEDQKFTATLGGIIGKVYNGGEITINAPHVRMFASDERDVMIYANSFGGFVGVVEGKETSLKLTGSSVLDMKGKGVKFFANQDDGNEGPFYYGLLVGSLEGELEVDSFSLLTEEQKDDDVAAMSQEDSLAKTFSMRVVSGGETSEYGDDDEKFGLGGFVGKQNGSITITKYEEPTIINLTAEGIPNVGGIAGLYVNGNISVDLSKVGLVATDSEDDNAAEPVDAELEYLFVVSGSTNVGGLFGFAATTSLGKFETKSSAEQQQKEYSLLNSGKPYALVIVHGSNEAGHEHKNFGGLFGKLSGTGEINKNEDSIFVNNNPIFIGSSCGEYKFEGGVVKFTNVGSGEESIAYNVGGVVGSLRVTSAHKFVNNAEIKRLGDNIIKEDTITVRDQVSDETVRKVAIIESIQNISEMQSDQSDQSEFVCRTVNVGGVAGQVTFENTKVESNILTSMLNCEPVTGYQNVGGIVGYIDSASLNNSNVTFVGDEENEGANATRAHTYGTVSGVINVGGAFGYAKLSSIRGVYANSNVFGNANVGGMAGFAVGSSFDTCSVGHAPNKNDEEEVAVAQDEGSEGEGEGENEEIDTERLVVGGIYYIHNKLKKTNEGNKTTTYIPTSVGGFIGGMDQLTKESMEYACTINNSTITNVFVTSAREGGADYQQKTISINYNNMFEVLVGEGNNNSSRYDEIIKITPDDQKIHFSRISSGFGGLIGTTATSAIVDINLSATDVSVNATLGVNVGYLYGAFRVDDGNSMNMNYRISLKEGDRNIKVDGAYNIGGIAGLLKSDNDLSGFTMPTLSTPIYVESELTGINVGGIFGKTECNNINGLEMTGDMADKISISTAKSYYIGGLIGVAQVSGEAQLSGLKIPDASALFSGDAKENVGAFIGRLKVTNDSPGGQSAKITVEGEHHEYFTINTIENENYQDGTTIKNLRTDNGLAELYAEAFYINKDQFNISGSDEIFYSNPLRPYAHGWSREYTAFRRIQRCIPAEKNNQIWDSTTPFYDAANITHVALKDYTGPIVNVEDSPDKENYDKAYKTKDIKYTIYRSFEEEEILYCGMGIAKAMYNTDPANEDTYATPNSNLTNIFELMIAPFTEEKPDSVVYLDYNAPATVKDSDGVVTTVEDKNLERFDFTGEYEVYAKGSWEGLPWEDSLPYKFGENQVTYVIYFVEDYMAGAGKGQAGEVMYNNDEGKKGAFFQFEAVFNNTTLKKLDTKYDFEQEVDSISPSGSLFDVCGTFDKNLLEYIQEKGFPWFGFTMVMLNVVVDVVLFFCSSGLGNAAKSAGRTAVKGAAKGTKAAAKAAKAAKTVKKASRFGKAVKTTKNATKGALSVKKALAIGTVFAAGSTLVTAFYYTASAFFVQPKEDPFGFFGTSYSRYIEYELTTDGKMRLKNLNSEQLKTDKGEDYVFYSTERPVDFASNSYITTMVYNDDEVKSGYNDLIKEKKLTVKVENIDGADNKLENFLNEELIQYDPINPNHKLYEGVTITFETKNETSNETILVDENDVEQNNIKKCYVLQNKYQYVNGKYYIHLYCCDMTTVRTTLEFTPEQITPKEGLTAGTKEFKTTPDWISDGGNYYVSGKFNDNECYEYDSYTGNNLTYSAEGGYKINGKTFDSTEIEKESKQQFTYVLADKSEIVTTNKDGTEENPYTEGYEYFTKAYYTAEENSRNWPASKTKTRDFYYCGNSAPTEGEINVHYVEVTQRDKNDEVVGRKYYTIYPISGADTISVPLYPNRFINPYKDDFDGDGKVDVDVDNDGYADVDDDIIDLILDLSDKNEWFIHEDFVNSANKIGEIYHSPTYFLYEGGYFVDSGNMDLTKVKDDGTTEEYSSWVDAVQDGVIAPVYTRVTKAQEISVITISETETGSGEKRALVEKGNTGKLTILDDYNNLSEYYIVGSGGTKVGDMYKAVNGVLYVYNENYTLGEDLLLHRLVISVPQEERKDVTQLENLYLTDSNVGLYTYYKYDDRLTTESSEWSETDKNTKVTTKYYLIPQSSRDTTLNNKPTVFVENCRIMFGYAPNGDRYGGSFTGGKIQVN